MGLEQRGITPQTPRDRLLSFGPATLTTGELLTVVLGTGTTSEPANVLSQRLLAEHDSLIGLARLSFTELCDLPGVGIAKAAQLQAVFELSRRIAHEVIGERPQIRTPSDAAQLLMLDMPLLEQEQLRVMLLDTRMSIVG